MGEGEQIVVISNNIERFKFLVGRCVILGLNKRSLLNFDIFLLFKEILFFFLGKGLELYLNIKV